ncbi:hypothetical protein ONR57_02500 [Hoyosella sp. YIM 151337]|uniref:hypothetical protein n=1 Tax=Hoyosella sp. YIM 151337 TaxID=2992742 RepID=UPI0022364361|nr:hypothetical protein [Hoyosella sp. YIM 151337]MCW4352165.1 hypothetical protein [Hoyosella sp. YIM 151337]
MSSIPCRAVVVTASAAGLVLAASSIATAQEFGELPQVTSGHAVIQVAFTTPGGWQHAKDCDVTVSGENTFVPVNITQSSSLVGGEEQSFTFAPLPPGDYTVEVYCVNTNPNQIPPNEWSFSESGVTVTFPDDIFEIIDLLVTYLS